MKQGSRAGSWHQTSRVLESTKRQGKRVVLCVRTCLELSKREAFLIVALDLQQAGQ